MPLGLMVTAGVVPSHWQVEIVDECISPVSITPDADLIGITAMTCQAVRAYEIADAYRKLGKPVILGGIHPSALPDEALAHATAVAVGEAEGTLPQMLRDFEAGMLAGIYRTQGVPRIATPRRDLLNRRDYLVNNCVQISRGCPHRCRFCTTQAMYQGRYNTRPVDEILQELRDMNAKWVIFADDNIFGNPPWSREFFTKLTKLRIRWAGQASINVARDRGLLALMKRSGCMGVILGLESPSPASLAEGNKTYCKPEDYIPLIQQIHAAHIGTWGSFIFGFDSDNVQTLQAAVKFARKAKIGITIYPILTPYPGTPIYDEYSAAGRILTRDWSRYTGATVVFQPKQMTPRQLANCQVAAFREFNSWSSILERINPLRQRATFLVNLSMHLGFRHYYHRQKKNWPDFRDAETW